MDFKWRETGFGLESEPFQWDESALGVLILNRQSAPRDASSTLSLYTKEAPEDRVWRLRMSATPQVGTTALVTDVAPGTWVRFRWDYAGGPQAPPKITIP